MELADLVNTGGYDLAFVQPCYLTQAPYILQYLKIPSLYSCPEPKREFYEKIPRVSNKLTYALTYPFRKPLKRIDFENTIRASKVVTLSKYSQDRLRKVYHIEPLLNYLGVDITLFKPINVSIDNLVITVGSLSLHKGHDFLIRSLGKIDHAIRPTLLIVGPVGVEIKYLLKLSKDYGVNCEIVNNLPDNELVVWLNKAKIFLGGAINEPFGLAILEALSCGTYVLAVGEGGVTEIIENKDLGLLTIRDENEFARKITQILMSKNQTDKNYMHEYIKKRWSWDISVRNLEKIMKEMVI
jgi:glycosyltransferase involved in cell wall biosynthesis